VAGGPDYDPDLERDADTWGHIYNYGYQPYWAAGYMYPMFPWYPLGVLPSRH